MECEPDTSLSNVDFPPIAMRCMKCSRSRWKTDQSYSQSIHVWTDSNSIGCTLESDCHAEALDYIAKYLGFGSYFSWEESAGVGLIQAQLLPNDL